MAANQDVSKYQDKGLEHTPEHTPEVTPRVTPENVGHLSGGEVNQLNIGSKEPQRQPKN